MSGEIKQMLTDIKSELHSDMQSLTARIDKLETLSHSASASQNASPQDIFSQAPAFGNSAITAVPSNLQISDLDLANKNILWTRVTSAGIPLPLPLDSCCSLSLVSQTHAEVICKTHPTMQFTKLSTPLPVSVANLHAQLKAIGTVQVPIIWGNGRASIFSMLVVPHLAWPFLFGQNHLRMIQAHTDHAGLKVRFDHPSLKFTITCCDENPFVAFPPLANQNSSQPQKTVHSSHSSVLPPTCLLTPMPPPTQPKERITLHRGFHVVSFCLLLASSLTGPSLLVGPMWLEGQEICPGVQVISGPIDLATVPSSFSLESPQAFGILVPQSHDSLNDVPSFLQTFHAHVVVRSNKNKVSLPFNANLGFVRPQTSADQQVFQDAANHTADQLASSWLQFAESVQNNNFYFPPSQDQFDATCFSHGQNRLMGHIPTRGVPTHPLPIHGSCMPKLRKWHKLG